jgi:RNA polymerase sigma-70 factor (sigma-E family)
VPETDVSGVDFAEFVDGSLPGLLRFGYVLTGDAQEAEDLVQDALAKSLRRWRRVQADNPVAYTRRIMVNTHLTRWRRWGARVRLGGVPEAATDDAGLRRGEDWDALRRTLALLPPRQRAVLVLRYLEDLPDATIAVLLGCSPGTVRSHASRGLAALRLRRLAQDRPDQHCDQHTRQADRCPLRATRWDRDHAMTRHIQH